MMPPKMLKEFFVVSVRLFGLVTMSLLLLGAATWFFDPIVQVIDAGKLDLNNSDNYWVVDQYEELRTTKKEVDISVVIPAYNEENRLLGTLDNTFSFLDKWTKQKGMTYEILVVDDGSSDLTADRTLELYEGNADVLRFLKLNRNQGKGGAIKLGVAHAVGKYILMADADGATDINDLDKLFNVMKGTKKPNPIYGGDVGIVVGSRAHLEENSIATREWYRTILMKGFHMFVMALCTNKIRDTQCGFKLFTNTAAKLVFSNLHLYRWAFDIEVIFVSQKLNIPISEVAVNWHEVEGSKLITNRWSIVTTSLTMARDIICLRLAYLLGIWGLPVIPAGSDIRSEL